jgi:hypothetical protein
LGRAARSHKIAGYDHIPPAEALFPQLGLRADSVPPSGGGATAAANRNGAGGEAPLRPLKRATPNGRGDALPRKNNRAAVVSPPNNGEPGPDAATQAKIENSKKKGFLTWEGHDKRLPSCPVRVKMGAMTSHERICIHFIAQGGHCSYGNRCRSAHPTKFAELPAEAQTALAAWVGKTAGLAFVPDRDTPGTAE